MANNFLLLQDMLANGISPDAKFTDVSHFAYMWMNTSNKKLIASHSVYALLEIEPYSVFLTESEYRKYVHADDLFKLMSAEEKLSAQNRFSSVEYRIVTKKGTEKYLHHYMQLNTRNVNETRIISTLDDITEQKRADVILEVMNEGFFELDENFIFRRINAKTENYWKISRKDLIGKCIWEVFPQAVNTPYYTLIKEARQKHESVVESIICPVMGYWLHLSVSPYADGLVVTQYSIQKEKDAEQKIKQSNNLLQSIFDTSLIDMSVMKAVRDKSGMILDFRIQFVNKQIEKNSGRTDFVGKLYAEEYPGIKKTMIFDTLVKVVESGKSEQIEYYYNHEGLDNWYSSMFVKLDDGVVFTNLDITERKRAEEEQAKNLKLLQQSEELAKSGSWDYDIDTHNFLWSDGMYGLFEMEKGVPVKPPVYLDYVIEEDRHIAEKIVNEIQNNFQPFDETIRIKPDGIIKTLKIKAAPLKNENGKAEKFLGVDMDITAAKEAAEKISELNKTLIVKNRALQSVNSELQTFNSIAANDYQETFRHLYTNLEFIVTNDARNLSDSGKANLRRAQTAIQKMKLLTDDILTFSKIQKLDTRIEEVNLNEILKNVLVDLEKKITEANATIVSNELPVIQGFPLLLTLLFYHLLDNAVKFIKADVNPEIRIVYAKYENPQSKPDDVYITVYHRISIEDNGIGFDESEAEKIFQIFYRLHEKNKFRGSGIGLAVCKKIMDMHNGFINAKETEIGSEFCCYFPAE